MSSTTTKKIANFLANAFVIVMPIGATFANVVAFDQSVKDISEPIREIAHIAILGTGILITKTIFYHWQQRHPIDKP